MELGVQVAGASRVDVDLVADLVVHGGGLWRAVLQREPGVPWHRHRPVAVEAAVRVGEVVVDEVRRGVERKEHQVRSFVLG